MRLALPIAVLLFACGGSTASVDADRADAASSSGDMSSGRSSSGGGTSGGDACETINVGTDAVCSLLRAKSNTPLSIDVARDCAGCEENASCVVTVSGQTIQLAVHATQCSDRMCPEVCRKESVRCPIPALRSGHYEVQFGAQKRSELDVESTGKQTTCTIGGGSTTVTAAGLATSCNVPDDCTTVGTGDTCGYCGLCPSTPIAKSESTKYAERFADAYASCRRDGRPIPPCSPCPQPLVTCKNHQCVVGP